MSTITFIHPQYAVCRAKTEFCNDHKVDHSKSVVIDLEYVTNLHIVVITVYCTTKQWYRFEWGLHLWWWNHHSSCYKWKVWRSSKHIHHWPIHIQPSLMVICLMKRLVTDLKCITHTSQLKKLIGRKCHFPDCDKGIPEKSIEVHECGYAIKLVWECAGGHRYP